MGDNSGTMGASVPRRGGGQDAPQLPVEFFQVINYVPEYLRNIFHLLNFISILYNILSYILILRGWDSDNGSVPTDKRNKVSWINSILIQLNLFNVGGVSHNKGSLCIIYVRCMLYRPLER